MVQNTQNFTLILIFKFSKRTTNCENARAEFWFNSPDTPRVYKVITRTMHSYGLRRGVFLKEIKYEKAYDILSWQLLNFLFCLYLGPNEQEKLGITDSEYNRQKSAENSALDLLNSLNLTRD